MVTSGLVPSLTAEAARLASLGAGAKIIRVFSYELNDEDIAEIAALKPDIFLLTGGVDGGNSDCIAHNAAALSGIARDRRFPVIIAGNRAAAEKCEKLLAGWKTVRCPNVMPAMGKLNIEGVQEEIRKLFLERIIHAKGLSREKELIDGILMPTPQAVKKALELFASACGAELAAVDLGGATTDVYSVAKGLPKNDNVLLKGLPEPESKRTVEGDIGMRYSAQGVLEAVGEERLAVLAGASPSRDRPVEMRVPRGLFSAASETLLLPTPPAHPQLRCRDKASGLGEARQRKARHDARDRCGRGT
jgi:uncharacterized protein (TIGR01319 family)